MGKFWLGSLYIGIFFIPWVINIIRLASCDWIISGEEALRIVGIFVAPLGWVMGFIGHF